MFVGSRVRHYSLSSRPYGPSPGADQVIDGTFRFPTPFLETILLESSVSLVVTPDVS